MPPHKGGEAAMARAWARSKRLRRMTGLRFMAFCISGTLGFIADVAVLWLVHRRFMPPSWFKRIA